MQKAKLFSLPEQMAVAEILSLMQQKKMEIVNFKFFSRIESSPLEQTVPVERRIYGPDVRYLRTTVTFCCRGTKVAEVIMEGAVSVIRGAPGIIDSWRTAKIKARRYYWRDDKDEDQSWEEFVPMQQFYGDIKTGTNREEKRFLRKIEAALLYT